VDRDRVAADRSAVAERVERREAGAEERRRLLEGERLGDPREDGRRRDDVLGVAAVVVDPRDLERDRAREEVALTARAAVAAVSAVPADADLVAHLPRLDARSERVDDARDLMARSAREGDP